MPDIVKCCGKAATKSYNRPTNSYTLLCDKCGRIGNGSSPEKAAVAFAKSKPGATVGDTQEPAPQQTSKQNLPAQADQFPAYIASRMAEMARIAIPFIAAETPRLERLVQNNVRYIMIQKSEGFLKCWETPEGIESIVHALEEALSYGCELGKMGSIVPYSGIAIFIPGVECLNFALTNGSNPPFKWTQIDIIHENDIVDIQRLTGVFSCKIIPGPFRGEVISVAVYGYNNRLGHVVGEQYDASRLLAKAEIHSPSYKAYCRAIQSYEFARVERGEEKDPTGRLYAMVADVSPDAGKYFEQDVENFQAAEKAGELKKNSRGEYAEVELPKRGGGTWWKQIYRKAVENPGELQFKKAYRDEITNPYEGADQAEMLLKSGGKSFMMKYAKIRNSESAMDEIKGTVEGEALEMVDRSISAAFDNMDRPPQEYEDAEVVPEAAPGSASGGIAPDPQGSAEQKEADLQAEVEALASGEEEQGELPIY